VYIQQIKEMCIVHDAFHVKVIRC